jgi:hypothetical protein
MSKLSQKSNTKIFFKSNLLNTFFYEILMFRIKVWHLIEFMMI